MMRISHTYAYYIVDWALQKPGMRPSHSDEKKDPQSSYHVSRSYYH